ncbi:MAG: adenosylmethionine decarboxylase [Chlamydiia bacterium]|nr:adenosylmethionine decarboxylase [Chlamydiia bacterium]
MKYFLTTLILACSLFGYEFSGNHFVASYYGCNEQALIDVQRLEEVMLEASIASGAQVLNSISHHFDGQGLTMAVLLSESHASIHTYPEHRACFVDLFTCGEHCDHEKFHHVLAEYLKPRHYSGDLFDRN